MGRHSRKLLRGNQGISQPEWDLQGGGGSWSPQIERGVEKKEGRRKVGLASGACTDSLGDHREWQEEWRMRVSLCKGPKPAETGTGRFALERAGVGEQAPLLPADSQFLISLFLVP